MLWQRALIIWPIEYAGLRLWDFESTVPGTRRGTNNAIETRRPPNESSKNLKRETRTLEHKKYVKYARGDDLRSADSFIQNKNFHLTFSHTTLGCWMPVGFNVTTGATGRLTGRLTYSDIWITSVFPIYFVVFFPKRDNLWTRLPLSNLSSSTPVSSVASCPFDYPTI